MSSYLVSLTVLVGTAWVGSTVYDDQISSFKFGMGAGATREEAAKEAISSAIENLLDEYLEKGWDFDKKDALSKIKNENKFVNKITTTEVSKKDRLFIVSVKALFNIENITKEISELKPAVNNEHKIKTKPPNINEPSKKIIITVEASGTGKTEEEAKKNSFQAAIKKASDQIVLQTKTTINQEEIRGESKNLTIGTIKKVVKIKTEKNGNLFQAHGEFEVEAIINKKQKDNITVTVISEGEGQNEEQSLQDAITKGIEKTIGTYLKAEKELIDGNLREQVVEKLAASVSNKKVLNTVKTKTSTKTTIFFELDTSFVFKNLNQTSPNISKIDGVTFAARIETTKELARQTNIFVDLLIEDYYGCFDSTPVTDIKNLSFDKNGQFNLTYKYFIDKIKFAEFNEKWIPILEKTKIKKTRFSTATFLNHIDNSDFSKNQNILFIYLPDLKDNNFIYEYAVPGSFEELKNKNTSIKPVFEFIDKEEQVVRSFKTGIFKNPNRIYYISAKPLKAKYLPFPSDISGEISITESIRTDDLIKVTGIKCYFSKFEY